ncbi:unnamed protein product [Protopolystoma xenopodis]|uniref:KIF21A/B second helical domain-containing protein n=1 Tax=Protopolystoma xenopodis TaxID=117903 RepID=A0A3S5BLJ9_9PLAT|nr:unnamed protein product [Protopolystoma xenopodis]
MTRSYTANTPSLVGGRPFTRRPLSGIRQKLSRPTTVTSFGVTSACQTRPASRQTRFGLSCQAKWALLNKQVVASVQRRETAERLEHDMSTWMRERQSLGRRLARVKRRLAREEVRLTSAEESGKESSQMERLRTRVQQSHEQV